MFTTALAERKTDEDDGKVGASGSRDNILIVHSTRAVRNYGTTEVQRRAVPVPLRFMVYSSALVAVLTDVATVSNEFWVAPVATIHTFIERLIDYNQNIGEQASRSM